MLVVANALNAEVIKGFGLTCGTKGFGPEYSIYYKRIGNDIGLPFYFHFNKYRSNDTLITTEVFECNVYANLNVIAFQQPFYDVAIGFTAFLPISYERTKIEPDSNSYYGSLNLDLKGGPCIQYIRKNNDKEKIFSIEFWPFTITNDANNKFDLSANIQLSYYFIRRRGI